MKIKILTAALLLMVTATANAQKEGGRGMDPAQRAQQQTTMMTDSLSLSAKQAEKVKAINLKYANKSKEARSNSDGDRDKMKASMETIRTEQNAELKKVLTQEQYDRWQTISSKQMKRYGPGGGGSYGPGGGGSK